MITEPLQVKDGFLPVPKKPGWGIELDMDMIKKHPRIVAGSPSLFRGDNSIADW